MTREVQLTQGFVALVDDQDYERVMQFKWHVGIGRYTRYARKANGKGKFLYMHRFLTNAPAGMEVDHRDHNGLNCTRDNLRVCTPADNMRNIGLRSSSRSGFKGISYDKRYGTWYAHIRFTGGRLYLGTFHSPELAAIAYDAKARELHGEFAYQNFPLKGDSS